MHLCGTSSSSSTSGGHQAKPPPRAVLPRARPGSLCRPLPRLAAAPGPAPAPLTQDALSRDLIRFYHQVQEPALANRPYSGAVNDFTARAILAYECGYSEAHVREQIERALQAGDCGIAQKHAETFNTAECVVSIVLVWLTLMASPKGVTRWGTADAVSEKLLAQWKGFVGMIVDAYFNRRMAWYPLDRLSMEVAAMGGSPEPPDIIAERARLVFTTLERCYPQFPSDDR